MWRRIGCYTAAAGSVRGQRRATERALQSCQSCRVVRRTRLHETEPSRSVHPRPRSALVA